jgi:hypothetical protein
MTAALLVAALLVFPSLPIAQESTAEEVKRANTDLEEIAKNIATLCAQPGFRGFLRSEIAQSKNRESILELDKFLDRASKQKNMPPGLRKAKENASKTIDRLSSKGLESLRGLDLYIPVEAHRTKWKGGKDFVVAYAPLGNEKDVSNIVAYSVSNGERVLLDSKTPPEQVVLIVAPEEHMSHEVGEELRTGPEPDPSKIRVDDDGTDEDNSYFGIPMVKLLHDHEPWYLGGPEVYVLIGQKSSKGTQPSKINLTEVDKENTWYYIYLNFAAAPTAGTVLYFYFDSTFDKMVYVDFKESDTGWLIDYDVSPYGVGIPDDGGTWHYRIGVFDDDMGNLWVNRTLVAWNGFTTALFQDGSTKFSTGDVQFRAELDH